VSTDRPPGSEQGWSPDTGQQPSSYPGQQPSSYPGQQPYPDPQGQQPSSYPGQQPSSYPGQQPYPDHQGQQPYPDQPAPYAGYGSGGQPTGSTWPASTTPSYPAASSQWPSQPAPRRPGGVTAASAITIVMTVLTSMFWLVVGGAALTAGDSVVREAARRADIQRALDDAGMTLTNLRDTITAVGVVSLVVGGLMLLAIIPAVGVLRGSKAARITLVVLSVLTILIGLFSTVIGLVFGLVWAAAAGVVIALLYAGGASRWFASRSRPSAPASDIRPPQPW